MTAAAGRRGGRSAAGQRAGPASRAAGRIRTVTKGEGTSSWLSRRARLTNHLHRDGRELRAARRRRRKGVVTLVDLTEGLMMTSRGALPATGSMPRAGPAPAHRRDRDGSGSNGGGDADVTGLNPRSGHRRGGSTFFRRMRRRSKPRRRAAATDKDRSGRLSRFPRRRSFVRRHRIRRRFPRRRRARHGFKFRRGVRHEDPTHAEDPIRGAAAAADADERGLPPRSPTAFGRGADGAPLTRRRRRLVAVVQLTLASGVDDVGKTTRAARTSSTTGEDEPAPAAGRVQPAGRSTGGRRGRARRRRTRRRRSSP